MIKMKDLYNKYNITPYEDPELAQLQYCYMSHHKEAWEAFLRNDHEAVKRENAECEAIYKRMCEKLASK